MTYDSIDKDYLWVNLRDLPYFRALLRAVEARFYQNYPLPAPTLDIGCGDGHFASVAFEHPLAVGIDPWQQPLRQATRMRSHRFLVQGSGSQMPFADRIFASAISNSVLEHIPDVEAVLAETARLLKPEAPFLFCVPNHTFLTQLSIGQALDNIKLHSLGDTYRLFFNRISRHIHCDPPEVWRSRLEKAGFCLERWWHYFSPRALHTLEWGHYFGLPSLVSHILIGRWILAPTRWNLALTRRIVARHYRDDPIHEDGVYTFYIARRG